MSKFQLDVACWLRGGTSTGTAGGSATNAASQIALGDVNLALVMQVNCPGRQAAHVVVGGFHLF
jgi:hypothetical protein